MHLKHHQRSSTRSTQLRLLIHSSSCSAIASQFAIPSVIQSCDTCMTQHTLVVCASWQAANDPIAPAKAIPRQAMKDNPDCILVVTPCGGHLGWVSGPGAPLGQLVPFSLFPGVVLSCTDVPLHACTPLSPSYKVHLSLFLLYRQAMAFYSALAHAYQSHSSCTWLCYSLTTCEPVSNYTSCTWLWLTSGFM